MTKAVSNMEICFIVYLVYCKTFILFIFTSFMFFRKYNLHISKNGCIRCNFVFLSNDRIVWSSMFQLLYSYRQFVLVLGEFWFSFITGGVETILIQISFFASL